MKIKNKKKKENKIKLKYKFKPNNFFFSSQNIMEEKTENQIKNKKQEMFQKIVLKNSF